MVSKKVISLKINTSDQIFVEKTLPNPSSQTQTPTIKAATRRDVFSYSMIHAIAGSISEIADVIAAKVTSTKKIHPKN